MSDSNYFGEIVTAFITVPATALVTHLINRSSTTTAKLIDEGKELKCLIGDICDSTTKYFTSRLDPNAASIEEALILNQVKRLKVKSESFRVERTTFFNDEFLERITSFEEALMAPPFRERDNTSLSPEDPVLIKIREEESSLVKSIDKYVNHHR